MRQLLIFYGAGEWAKTHLAEWEREGLIPLCFADSDERKHHIQMQGHNNSYEILSLAMALSRYPGSQIFCSVSPNTTKLVIQDYLVRELGIDPEMIVNYEPYARGVYCKELLNNCSFISRKGPEYCCLCYGRNASPFVAYAGANTASQFVAYRQELMEKLNSGIDCACTGCQELREGLYYTAQKLHRVDFGSFDHYDRCNLKCKYCSLQFYLPKDGDHYNAFCGLPLEHRIEICEQFVALGEINRDTIISLSCGEPAIHPKIDQLMELFPDHKYWIFSNATVYRQQFADKIRDGRSQMMISLDCGTREMYSKIRGIDAFDRVLHNCRKYAAAGWVQLKYILMDGINTSDVEAKNFANICRDVNPAIVHLINDKIDYDIPLSKQAGAFIEHIASACEAYSIPCSLDRSLKRESYY